MMFDKTDHLQAVWLIDFWITWRQELWITSGTAIRDFTIYDAVVNENATKQQYHWLKEEK